MYIEVLKSKIHRVTVTRANLDYIGSITVDSALMHAAGLFEGEKVSVVNVTNGNRVETYVIPGEEGSGSIEGLLTFFNRSYQLRITDFRRCDMNSPRF